MDKIKLLSPLVISVVFIVQGCATTDELFAEYDQNFCPAIEDHANHEPHGSSAVDASIPWEAMVYFRAGSSVLSAQGSEILKANAVQLKNMPGYKISLKSMSGDQIADEFNRTLYSKRIDSIKHLLIEVLGFNTDQIVVSGLIEDKLAVVPNDMQDVALVDIDRRIGMLLLDQNSMPVSLQPAQSRAANTLTDRAWAKAPTTESAPPKRAVVPSALPVPVSKPAVTSNTVAALPVAAAPQPTMPAPAAAAPVPPMPAIMTASPVAAAPLASVASTPGMRTITYEKWTVTEPATAAVTYLQPTMPVVATAATIPAEDETTTETYTLEQAELARGITVDLKRRRLTRPLGHSAYDKILRLREIHPTHDYSVNGHRYVARILLLVGRKAVGRGDLELARVYLHRAMQIDPTAKRQKQLQASIAAKAAQKSEAIEVNSAPKATRKTAYLPSSTSAFVGPKKPSVAAALPEVPEPIPAEIVGPKQIQP